MSESTLQNKFLSKQMKIKQKHCKDSWVNVFKLSFLSL